MVWVARAGAFKVGGKFSLNPRPPAAQWQGSSLPSVRLPRPDLVSQSDETVRVNPDT